MRLLMVVLLLLSGWLFGIELERGKSYEGPVKLTAKSLGVGFGISHEWIAFLPESGGLKLNSKEGDITIIMRSREFTAEDALRYLNLPVEYEAGVMLFPSRLIDELTSTKFRRSFRVSGRNAEAAIYVVLGPQHRAVVMTGLCPSGKSDVMKTEMLSLANTITFTQIKPLKDDQNSLKKRVEGGYFTYYETVGLRSEKRELWLCSNGRFVLRERQAVGSGTSGVLMEHRGSWLVGGSVLQLQFADGSQKPIRLREEGSAIFFNESRSYRLTNRVCR